MATGGVYIKHPPQLEVIINLRDVSLLKYTHDRVGHFWWSSKFYELTSNIRPFGPQLEKSIDILIDDREIDVITRKNRAPYV